MQKKKFTGSVNGKGYYIALALCAVAIGIAGILYYRNADEPADSLEVPDITVSVQDQNPNDDHPVGATVPKSDEQMAGTQATTPQTVTVKTVSPLTGQTVAVYAMDSLTYNQTTRDWRVHNGIDIAAETGAKVCAAADGEVYSVYDDAAMGMTVVIRHANGYTSCYASLAEDVKVEPGDMVTAGEVIGAVGNTALMESALGDHLHFSVTKDGTIIDPAKFLALK